MKEVVKATLAMFKGGVDSFQKRSTKTLNVFKKTVVELQSLNTEIEAEVTKREETIQKLNDESKTLAKQAADNEKVILKISEFFDGAL